MVLDCVNHLLAELFEFLDVEAGIFRDGYRNSSFYAGRRLEHLELMGEEGPTEVCLHDACNTDLACAEEIEDHLALGRAGQVLGVPECNPDWLIKVVLLFELVVVLEAVIPEQFSYTCQLFTPHI